MRLGLLLRWAAAQGLVPCSASEIHGPATHPVRLTIPGGRSGREVRALKMDAR